MYFLKKKETLPQFHHSCSCRQYFTNIYVLHMLLNVRVCNHIDRHSMCACICISTSHECIGVVKAKYCQNFNFADSFVHFRIAFCTYFQSVPVLLLQVRMEIEESLPFPRVIYLDRPKGTHF